MQPPKTRRVIRSMDSVPGLAMILERPGRGPIPLVISEQHPTLTCGGHNLVLAKGERRQVSKRPYQLAINSSTMCLGAILDHKQSLAASQCHDRGHITGPSGQVHSDNRLRTIRDGRLNCRGRYVLTIGIHINEHGRGTCEQNAARRGKITSRRDNNFITRPNTQHSHRQL